MGDTDVEVQEGVAEGQEIVSGSYKALRSLKDEAKLKVDNKKKTT
jgi:HlyD family secretion protein